MTTSFARCFSALYSCCGVGTGRSTKHNGVEDGEHRHRAANPQREGQHGDDADERVPEQHADRVTEVSEHGGRRAATMPVALPRDPDWPLAVSVRFRALASGPGTPLTLDCEAQDRGNNSSSPF